MADHPPAIQLISAARDLEPEYKYLTIRLRLEQQRLYNWSSEVGIMKYLEDDEVKISRSFKGLSRNTIIDTLLQIQTLSLNFIKFGDQFGSLDPDGGCQEMETLHERADEEVSDHFPQMMQFLKKLRSSTPLLRGLPRRLKWATFYREKYENLINRLRELNDILIDLVDGDARIAIVRTTRETNTTVLHMHSKIDELVQLVKALSPSPSSGVPIIEMAGLRGTMCLTTQQQQQQQQHEFAALAHFKAANTSIQSGVSFEGTHGKDMKLARYDFQFISTVEDVDGRCEADYHPSGRYNRRVWIEWRDYDTNVPLEADISKSRLSRIDRLVALLSDPNKPDLLRVPRCLGYVNDGFIAGEESCSGSRLGFVFEKPDPAASAPLSLREILKSRRKPLFTDRIALATAVSSSLMSLHSVNWLHKGLRSHNIIFFPHADGLLSYDCPFLAGFGFSRPALRKDMTEIPSKNPEYDMYKHPLMHGLGPWEDRQGFKRTFDIFSLGIILVEIANWETIDQTLELGDPSTLDKHTLASIQQRLIEEEVYMDTIGSNAGRRFKDATLSCLRGAPAFGVGTHDDETNELVAAKLSCKFYDQVLRRLEEVQT